MTSSLKASTLDVDVERTRRTSDLPDFIRVVPPVGESDVDEILEDGLAMQAELERYRLQASDTFIELDDFFESLGG